MEQGGLAKGDNAPGVHGGAEPAQDEALARVLEAVRAVASEAGGDRALRAVSEGASLERDLGLGSLERAELLLRLEAAFGRSFPDSLVEADTPGELARLARLGGDPAPRPESKGPAWSEARQLGGSFGTLHEALRLRAEDEPGRIHARVEGDDLEATLSYGALYEDARLMAGALRDRGVSPGTPVALMLPTGVDFLRTFQGILLAGGIPVPLYPPARLDRLKDYAERQSAILRDCGAPLLVTLPAVRALRGLLGGQAALATAEELLASGRSAEPARDDGSAPALIQYTSGSTGRPKGVLLTHANLLANIEAIAQGLAARPTDVGVSWLPLYHDMGLIGSWLFCLVRGYPIVLLPPLAFLSRPERWLWAIHRHRATLSAAPNFAYELCARRIGDGALEGLDLSSWRCALNGAEPVSPDTLGRFLARFEPRGFRKEAMFPVYGLAENSVALLFPVPGGPPRIDRVDRSAFGETGSARESTASNALRFVSVGRALPRHEVRIVAEDGGTCPERVVGRLHFRGPSMTRGYFRNEEATAAILRGDGFLDSGDLAYAAEGEVFITGRVKDLIIKAGRNIVPQEIEELAGSVPGVRRGCVVAFGVPRESEGTEALVVVAETREKDHEALAAAVRTAVADALGLPPDEVVLVPPGAIPKTPSGKVRRQATRELHLQGVLGRALGDPLPTRLRLLGAVVAGGVRGAGLRAVRLLYGAYLALLLVAVGLPAWALALVLPRGHAVHVLSRGVSRLLLFLGGIRLEVEGLHNLAPGRSLLLAANHASYLDVPVLLAALPMDFLFLAKQEVERYPVVATVVRRAGHLTVDRGSSPDRLAAAREVERATREGRAILVFPEATFTAATGLRPFRLGAFKTAVETGVPVVPLALRGARRALRDGTWIPRPGRVSLWIGAPLLPEGSDWAGAVALRDRTQALIADHCGEPLLQMLAGGLP
jgi:1-acyl-sn-glycerol-3-phosphate acyltransferase